ncbi:MAG: hypothetical protein ABIN89_08220 [Chitinophagaceae bacterium]
MKLNVIITMFLVASGMIVQGQNSKKELNKSEFYAAMASENLVSVDALLKEVTNSSVSNKEAYEGALLMKKAGLASGLGKKFNLFKSGHKKLDKSIEKENKNAEFRFFRLMIQEQAPGILNYYSQIDEDSQLIKSEYKNLPQVVQKAIVNYSKKSKVLKPEFF